MQLGSVDRQDAKNKPAPVDPSESHGLSFFEQAIMIPWRRGKEREG